MKTLRVFSLAILLTSIDFISSGISTSSMLYAQARDLGAERILIDDGAGHAVRFVTPAGLTDPVIDWVVSIPPVSGMDAGFVPVGTLANKYLIWNNASLFWEPRPVAIEFPYSQTGSTAAYAVALENTGTGGGISVHLSNAASTLRGVSVQHDGTGQGVFSIASGGNGVWGITGSSFSAGVIGDNTDGEAVVGRSQSNTAGAVVGRSDGSGYGVRGFNAADGIGVFGQAGISGGTGIAGRFENLNSANSSTTLEVETNGTGIGIDVLLSDPGSSGNAINVDVAGSGTGVNVNSVDGMGVWATSGSSSSAAVLGDNSTGEAVVGRTLAGFGIGAVVGRSDGAGYGVRGFNTANGIGVFGQAGLSGGIGVAARFENTNVLNGLDALQVVTASAGNAASFTGNVVITGDLDVSGNVSKGGGSFKIDHPLDPKNRYLYHSFVESPEMKNIYDGVIALDENGNATVQLPEWFEAVNMDFRYQLTSIGAPGPGLYISEEVKNNTFRISGCVPGMRVSWMLTGVRNDPYSRANRIQVEVQKSEKDRGTYMHPEAYGEARKKPVFLMENLPSNAAAINRASEQPSSAVKEISSRSTTRAAQQKPPAASDTPAAAREVKALPKN